MLIDDIAMVGGEGEQIASEARALARRLVLEARLDTKGVAAADLETILDVVASADVHGHRVAYLSLQGERVCRVCGCSEQDACVDDIDGPCAWAGQELCTQCEPHLKARGVIAVSAPRAEGQGVATIANPDAEALRNAVNDLLERLDEGEPVSPETIEDVRAALGKLETPYAA